MIRRYLQPQVERDLARKMVFLAGPRQVGKTTLALALEGAREGYLCWDVPEHRERILRRELPPASLWIFDELHKWRSWRNFLKGLWDAAPGARRILVTGSARLEVLRYSGDSLQGRYHLLRLHPFSVAELGLASREDLEQLVLLGGFPEPFLSGSQTEARRWAREYRMLLVHEEVRTLTAMRDLAALELLMLRVPELVGSPLSVNALREDLGVAHRTAASWLDALERLYAFFRVPPFGGPRLRTLKKAQKLYLFLWNQVPDPGPRFENLVACHLLKWTSFLQDVEGRDVELRYYRDSEGREVDFVVTERRQPVLMVETKLSDSRPSRGLRYLAARFPGAEAWQIALDGRKDYVTPGGIRVAPALTFLRRLV